MEYLKEFYRSVIKNLLIVLVGDVSDVTVMLGVLPSRFSFVEFCSSTAESVCSTNLLMALFKLFALKIIVKCVI